MRGFVSVISPTGQLYVRLASIVSYQKAGQLDGYNIKLSNGGMLYASEFEDKPSGFVTIRYDGKVRHIAIRHIDTVRLNDDGRGFTVKTSDGYVHKAEGGVGSIIAAIESYEGR